MENVKRMGNCRRVATRGVCLSIDYRYDFLACPSNVSATVMSGRGDWFYVHRSYYTSSKAAGRKG